MGSDDVMRIETSRLVLQPASTALAEQVTSGLTATDDHWSPDFPCADAVLLAGMFVVRNALNETRKPFGLYLIERCRDGTVVGGIDFKGRPHAGVVEIGYALAPSARGHGLAAEAVSAPCGLARTYGVACVVATTTAANIASQRTLERAGFTCSDANVSAGSNERGYSLLLRPAPTDSRW